MLAHRRKREKNEEFTQGRQTYYKLAKGQIMKARLPRTIFIRTNLGNDAIKLVEVLKEFKYFNKSVENHSIKLKTIQSKPFIDINILGKNNDRLY